LKIQLGRIVKDFKWNLFIKEFEFGLRNGKSPLLKGNSTNYMQLSNFHVFENFDLTKLPSFIDGKKYKVDGKTSI